MAQHQVKIKSTDAAKGKNTSEQTSLLDTNDLTGQKISSAAGDTTLPNWAAVQKKMTATNPASNLQFLGNVPPATDTKSIHKIAASGITGLSQSLPYLNQIQKSFGAHNVSNIRAYIGNKATLANHAIGSKAYASGNSIAFANNPSLYTVAHETAHIIQQRNGIALKDGVGKINDSYEQEADKVAETVVQNGNTERLLSKYDIKNNSAISNPVTNNIQMQIDTSTINDEGKNVYYDTAVSNKKYYYGGKSKIINQPLFFAIEFFKDYTEDELKSLSDIAKRNDPNTFTATNDIILNPGRYQTALNTIGFTKLKKLNPKKRSSKKQGTEEVSKTPKEPLTEAKAFQRLGLPTDIGKDNAAKALNRRLTGAEGGKNLLDDFIKTEEIKLSELADLFISYEDKEGLNQYIEDNLDSSLHKKEKDEEKVKLTNEYKNIKLEAIRQILKESIKFIDTDSQSDELHDVLDVLIKAYPYIYSDFLMFNKVKLYSKPIELFKHIVRASKGNEDFNTDALSEGADFRTPNARGKIKISTSANLYQLGSDKKLQLNKRKILKVGTDSTLKEDLYIKIEGKPDIFVKIPKGLTVIAKKHEFEVDNGGIENENEENEHQKMSMQYFRYKTINDYKKYSEKGRARRKVKGKAKGKNGRDTENGFPRKPDETDVGSNKGEQSKGKKKITRSNPPVKKLVDTKQESPNGKGELDIASLPDKPNAGDLEHSFTYTGTVMRHDRGAGQYEAMKKWSAREYAIAAKNEPTVDKSITDKIPTGVQYEWLHIRGAGLGGITDYTNLLAGTEEANSLMIPLEKRIAFWGRRATSKQPLNVTFKGYNFDDPAYNLGKKITIELSAPKGIPIKPIDENKGYKPLPAINNFLVTFDTLRPKVNDKLTSLFYKGPFEPQYDVENEDVGTSATSKPVITTNNSESSDNHSVSKDNGDLEKGIVRDKSQAKGKERVRDDEEADGSDSNVDVTTDVLPQSQTDLDKSQFVSALGLGGDHNVDITDLLSQSQTDIGEDQSVPLSSEKDKGNKVDAGSEEDTGIISITLDELYKRRPKKDKGSTSGSTQVLDSGNGTANLTLITSDEKSTSGSTSTTRKRKKPERTSDSTSEPPASQTVTSDLNAATSDEGGASNSTLTSDSAQSAGGSSKKLKQSKDVNYTGNTTDLTPTSDTSQGVDNSQSKGKTKRKRKDKN